MQKKRNTLMKFLIAYKWAVLAVLIVITIIVCLRKEGFLEKCNMPSGIECLDFSYDSAEGNIEISIKNNAGFDMSGVSVAVKGIGCNAASTGGSEILIDAQEDTYSVTCSPESGEFKGDVYFTFTNQQTGVEQTEIGELILNIP